LTTGPTVDVFDWNLSAGIYNNGFTFGISNSTIIVNNRQLEIKPDFIVRQFSSSNPNITTPSSDWVPFELSYSQDATNGFNIKSGGNYIFPNAPFVGYKVIPNTDPTVWYTGSWKINFRAFDAIAGGDNGTTPANNINSNDFYSENNVTAFTVIINIT
jgi:hypothetical protein